MEDILISILLGNYDPKTFEYWLVLVAVMVATMQMVEMMIALVEDLMEERIVVMMGRRGGMMT